MNSEKSANSVEAVGSWRELAKEPPTGELLTGIVLAWSETKRGGYMLWTPEMNGETISERAHALGVTHWMPLAHPPTR